MKFLNYIILLSIFLTLNGCFTKPMPPLTGTSKANKILQSDVYQKIISLLESKRCKDSESISNIKSEIFSGYELWSFSACKKKYIASIIYSYNRENNQTYYAIDFLRKEKEKKYHANVYTLNEYIKKMPLLNEYQIQFGNSFLEYLKINKLPNTNTKNDATKKLKSLILNKKYTSFENIFQDKTFFNTYHIDGLYNSSTTLDTVVYTKNKALVTFSAASDYSFARNYYFLKLNKNYLSVYFIDWEGGCGGPIVEANLKSEGHLK